MGVSEETLPAGARHALDAVPGLTVGEFGVRETLDVPPVLADVVAATLPHCRPIIQDMINGQFLTAMRPGELVQLSAEYIDQSKPVWTFKPPRHKTQKRGKQRIIDLGQNVQAIIKKYLFASPMFPYTTASRRLRHVATCRQLTATRTILSGDTTADSSKATNLVVAIRTQRRSTNCGPCCSRL